MVYVFLADGFEETEAIAPIDMLRRAGKEVVTVGVTGKIVTGSHGIPVTADITEGELKSLSGTEMIVLPGGMPGTLNEESSEVVQGAVDYCVENNIPIGAICAAPSILGHKGILEGRTAVCYSGFEKDLKGAVIGNKGVVTDGNITTARGAGAAVEFGLELTAVLCGKTVSEKIRAAILCD
jgi:4-methyl-5(b-hydroxyethyl)-thiazole monophosphate biosynthesis